MSTNAAAQKLKLGRVWGYWRRPAAPSAVNAIYARGLSLSGRELKQSADPGRQQGHYHISQRQRTQLFVSIISAATADRLFGST